MVNPSEILQVVTLAMVGWVLKETIRHGRIIAVIRQKLNDLPCSKCKGEIKENGDDL